MAGKRDYKVYTLNAREVMRLAKSKDRCFDLGSEYDKSLIVEGEKLYAQSALFYQILKELGRKDSPEALTSKLVYMHFEGGVKDVEKAARELLEKGIKLKFRGEKDFTTFVPFDKSASMSRDNVISFISEDVYDAVDRSLSLGLMWHLLNERYPNCIEPSKYYAYRGLYLTDGIRIKPSALELNERTVIVIKNGKVPIYERNMSVSNEVTGGKIVVSHEKVTVEENYDAVPFDGEGLVDPRFASLINRAAGYRSDAGATSFQIRLPYTKGMLHTVDFIRFLSDQLPNEDVDRLFITDVFGIGRKISDARIILTDSMFKCGKWLRKYFMVPETEEEDNEYQMDPMKYYFSAFRKYDHAMYVVSTDLNFKTDNTVKMNYQFLNTLDMDRETFERLIRRHIEETRSITSDPYTGRDAVLGTAEEDDSLFADISEESLGRMEAWEYALRSNVSFIDDPFIRKRLKQAQAGQTRGIRRGCLVVPGTIKYLSDDLLSLLIRIAEGCDVRYPEEADNRLSYLRKYRKLFSDKFYIAGRQSYKLDEKKYYAIFRSPHLSRNEQCLLKPAYMSIYNRYFSQLKGVIMVSLVSRAPAILGGADFDGDTVKIIRDDDINEAVFRGTYKLGTEITETENGVIERKVYQRKLPVVNINSPNVPGRPVMERITYEDLDAAFSSDVGRISNIAFALGKLEYGYDPDPSVPEGSTALCTIATGIEIDSVKTGVKPDISALEKLCRVEDDPFLKIDWKFSKIAADKRKKDKVIHARYNEEKGEYEAFFKYNGKTRDDIIYHIGDDQTCNVDLLPFYFARELKDQKAARKETAKKRSGFKLPEYRFTFEKKSDNWREKALEDPRTQTLRLIIGAYMKLHRDAWKFSNTREKTRNESLRGSVITLLYTEYDSSADRMYRSGAGLGEAIEAAYEELYNLVETSESAGRILAKMKASNWQYAMDYDERSAILDDIFGPDALSLTARELLCDTYDNGYQYFNYIMRDTRMFREVEEQDGNDSGGDYQIPEIREGGKKENIGTDRKKDEYSRDVYRQLHRYYWSSPYRRTVWSEQAGNFCRDAVYSLFDGNMEEAVRCTVALEDTHDRNHSFLWGVFTAEDISKVIYRETEGEADA